jgi:hypothetical protein
MINYTHTDADGDSICVDQGAPGPGNVAVEVETHGNDSATAYVPARGLLDALAAHLGLTVSNPEDVAPAPTLLNTSPFLVALDRAAEVATAFAEGKAQGYAQGHTDGAAETSGDFPCCASATAQDEAVAEVVGAAEAMGYERGVADTKRGAVLAFQIIQAAGESQAQAVIR